MMCIWCKIIVLKIFIVVNYQKKPKRITYTVVDIIKLAFQRRFTCSLEPVKVEVLKMKSVERFGQFDLFVERLE